MRRWPCLIRCCVASMRRFVVVGDHRIGEQPDRWSVDEDQRRALLAFGLQVTLIFSDRVQDQPVDPTAGEGIDHDPLAVWIVVGAGGQALRCHAV